MMAANEIFKKKFLVFACGGQLFGVDISTINTIIEKRDDLTRIPKAANFIDGVINLRGEIIPVMNLKKRFNLPLSEETEDARIVIVKSTDITMGISADRVKDVIEIDMQSVEKNEDIAAGSIDEFLTGCVALGSEIVCLLDIHKLVQP